MVLVDFIIEKLERHAFMDLDQRMKYRAVQPHINFEMTILWRYKQEGVRNQGYLV